MKSRLIGKKSFRHLQAPKHSLRVIVGEMKSELQTSLDSLGILAGKEEQLRPADDEFVV